MSFNTTALNTVVKTPTNTWIRPSDWPTTNEANGEIIYLVCDVGLTASVSFNLTTTFTKPASQNLYIEWGDGTTDTVSTNTSISTYHTYSVGGGTPCSRGYTTWKIRVYTDSGATITGAKLYTNPYVGNVFTAATNTIVPVLEAKYGSGVLESSPFNSTYTNFKYTYLEYVKLPSTWLGTTLASSYSNFYGLQRIDLPSSAPNLTTANNAFISCSNLRGDIVLPADAPITNTSNMFNLCNMISSFTWLGGSSLTNGSSMFNGANNLIRAELGNLTSASNLASLFSACYSLQIVKIKGFYTGTPSAIDMSSLFVNCSSLEYIELPTLNCLSGTTINIGGMFNGCNSLKTMTINVSSGTTISNYGSLFSNCYQLQSAYLYGTNSGGSSQGAFQNCYNLTNIVLFSGGSTATNIMFSSCYSLKVIDLTGFEQSADFLNAFFNCYSLTSLTLPSGTMSGSPTLTGAFTNCWRLSDLDLSKFSTATSLASVFSGCFNLKSIILPTTMNSVSSMNNAFLNCYGLTSVSLPTSMTSCTNFNGTFNNCYSIRRIVMPATVSASTTTFANAFNNCNSLESLTLPTTQTTSLTSGSGMFSTSGSLKEVKNSDKLGSNLITGTLVTFASNNYTPSISGLSFSCRMSAIDLSAISGFSSKLSSLRLLNTGGSQWTGTSPQVNISNTSIGYTALVQLFNDIAAQGTITSKTINITGCTGASSLTSADRLILTSKGWTITG